MSTKEIRPIAPARSRASAMPRTPIDMGIIIVERGTVEDEVCVAAIPLVLLAVPDTTALVASWFGVRTRVRVLRGVIDKLPVTPSTSPVAVVAG